MARKCEVCEKIPSFGNSVSHANNKTRRRWNPNLQRVKVVVNKTTKTIRVCTRCIKAGKIQKAA